MNQQSHQSNPIYERFHQLAQGYCLVGLSFGTSALDLILLSKTIEVINKMPEISTQISANLYLSLSGMAALGLYSSVQLFKAGTKKFLGHDLLD
ncbi:MAG TPA: hypothetical protein VJI98_02650 [Candidatus Nanoarchaeia archaeon]|nr:hypothetical protein [Candidatus Nanoarchaeia archaeon]